MKLNRIQFEATDDETRLLDLLTEKTRLGSRKGVLLMGMNLLAYCLKKRADGAVVGVRSPEGFSELLMPWDIAQESSEISYSTTASDNNRTKRTRPSFPRSKRLQSARKGDPGKSVVK